MLARWPRGSRGRQGATTCELAILLLQAMQRGETDATAGLSDRDRVTAHTVQLSLLRAMKAIQYWFGNGCVRGTEAGGLEVVRPAPAQVIAGWIPNVYAQESFPGFGTPRLCPQCRGYLPQVPAELKQYLAAEDSQTGDATALSAEPPPRMRAPAALRSDEALLVATHMVERHLAHNPYLSAGLTDPKHQDLAMQITDHLLIHGRTFESVSSYGAEKVAPDGATEWVRPPPAQVVAMLMGIGPDQNPEIERWRPPAAS